MNYLELLKKYTNKKVVGVGLGLLVIVSTMFYLISDVNQSEEIIKIDNGMAQVEEVGSNSGLAEIEYTEAMKYIGREAIVSGEILKVFTSKTKTTFLDFCEDFRKCPFTAVIFASDAKKFTDIGNLTGKVKVRGIIKEYDGRAEIIIKNPEQVMR